MNAGLGLLIARLYFDEDADARLAAALRARGFDVVTTVEAGLLEASDEEQLVYAVSQKSKPITSCANLPSAGIASRSRSSCARTKKNISPRSNRTAPKSTPCRCAARAAGHLDSAKLCYNESASEIARGIV